MRSPVLQVKVLWFTNIPLSEKDGEIAISRGTGSWMSSLINALLVETDISIEVVSYSSSKELKCYCGDNWKQWHVPRPIPANHCLTRSEIDTFKEITSKAEPDLIHFHGSELNYGLYATSDACNIPCVLSIQGLMGAYACHVNAGMGYFKALRYMTLRDFLKKNGILYVQKEFERASSMEAEIIRGVPNIIGRTRWDRAHVLAINPRATYFHCDEMIRDDFFGAKWEYAQCKKGRLFCLGGTEARKGLHTLIVSIAILRRRGVEVTLYVAGSKPTVGIRQTAYDKFLLALLKETQTAHLVEFLGPQTATQIVEQLQLANVFVNASHIENSCNAVSEAMVVGTPVVSTNAGGVATLIKDQISGLTCSAGDSESLAECIYMVLADSAGASDMSDRARIIARARHDRNSIVSRLVDIYSSVAKGAGKQLTDALRCQYDGTES